MKYGFYPRSRNPDPRFNEHDFMTRFYIALGQNNFFYFKKLISLLN